ncbi:MAG: hypothetical protein EG822_02770 [Deltaproteobacteria bacterium]|nr:hypothetical protein [Deltaproteobacteria bacterium]TLN00756.1 MAG: hypothetical protein FDZ73_18400 [bacterium]
MRIRKLSAGDIIEAGCTRCKSTLNHTIVAMVGERVVKVECNTCHGVHNYRGPVEKKEKTISQAAPKKPSVPRQAKKDPGLAAIEEWEALKLALNADQAIPYDMTRKFRANDLIHHASFGLGVVKSIIPPNKMEVLFQSGIKLLRCQ